MPRGQANVGYTGPDISEHQITLCELVLLANENNVQAVMSRLRSLVPKLFPDAKPGRDMRVASVTDQTDFRHLPMVYLSDKHGLDQRIVGYLEHYLGVVYIGDLLKWRYKDVVGIRGMGERYVAELRGAIQAAMPARQAREFLERLSPAL